MKTIRFIAVINIFASFCAYLWFMFTDFNLLYGTGISEKISKHWSFLTPHVHSYKFWHLTGLALIIMTVMQWQAISREKPDLIFSNRIRAAKYLIVLNQFFLALSISLKLNDAWLLSLPCSVIVLVSLLMINKKFEIHISANDCITQYITRKALGLYTGWLSYVIAYNFITTAIDEGWLYNMNSIFALSILCLVVLTIWIMFYALRTKLVSVSIGACLGLVGTFFQEKKLQADQQLVQTMHIAVLVSIILCISLSTYLTLRPKKENFGANTKQFP